MYAFCRAPIIKPGWERKTLAVCKALEHGAGPTLFCSQVVRVLTWAGHACGFESLQEEEGLKSRSPASQAMI